MGRLVHASARHPWQRPCPAGFLALLRLLRAPLSKFPRDAVPLSSLSVVFTPAAAVAAGRGLQEAQADAQATTLLLGSRLGNGGSSDVYTLGGAEAGGSGGDAQQGGLMPWGKEVGAVAVKVPRARAPSALQQYAREAEALAELLPTAAAQSGLVPRLVRRGYIAPSPEQPSSGGGNRPLSGPEASVLLLAPVGTSLEAALRADLSRRRRPAAARRALADRVAADVLSALRDAHALRIAHCDVRPQNVVVVAAASGAVAAERTARGRGPGRRASLVDWGLSESFGDTVVCTGVEAYAALEAVFVTRGADPKSSAPFVRAGRHVDLAAVAFLWFSIAYYGVGSSAAARALAKARGETACAALWLQWYLWEPHMVQAAARDGWLQEEVVFGSSEDPTAIAAARLVRLVFEEMGRKGEFADGDLHRRVFAAAGEAQQEGEGGPPEEEEMAAAIDRLYSWPWPLLR